jgi:hypothetical protein
MVWAVEKEEGNLGIELLLSQRNQSIEDRV